jgi:hypothetical protein
MVGVIAGTDAELERVVKVLALLDGIVTECSMTEGTVTVVIGTVCGVLVVLDDIPAEVDDVPVEVEIISVLLDVWVA